MAAKIGNTPQLPSRADVSKLRDELAHNLKAARDAVDASALDLAHSFQRIADETSADALPTMSLTERDRVALNKRSAARRAAQRALNEALAERQKLALESSRAVAAAKDYYANPIATVQALGTSPEGMVAFQMVDRLGHIGLRNQIESSLGKLAAGEKNALPFLGAAIFVLEKMRPENQPISIQSLAKRVVAHMPEYREMAEAIADAERAAVGVINIANDIAREGRISPDTKLLLGLMDRTNAVHGNTPRDAA